MTTVAPPSPEHCKGGSPATPRRAGSSALAQSACRSVLERRLRPPCRTFLQCILVSRCIASGGPL